MFGVLLSLGMGDLLVESRLRRLLLPGCTVKGGDGRWRVGSWSSQVQKIMVGNAVFTMTLGRHDRLST